MFEQTISRVDAGVADLLTADLSAVSGADIVAALVEAERVHRRWEAVRLRLVAEAETRRLAGDYARSTTADLLVTTLRVTPREARTRVRHATDLMPRTSLLGEALPPRFAGVADACTDGDISGEHVEVIADCLDRVPPNLSPHSTEVVEATLVEAARHEHPGGLLRTAALLLARLDQDGAEPDTDRAERERGLNLTRFADGSGRLTGRLTAEAAAVWSVVLDAVSAPAPSEDGMRDLRSAAQRRHDGLLDAGHRLLRSGSLPAAGGVPVTVLIRTTEPDLLRTRGIGVSGHGDVVSLARVTPALGEAELVPVALAASGAVLALGRSRRLAGRAQRLALAARDGGCCFPGCDRPASWSEVHHVIPWAEGGSTDLDNLCLLCRFHHREFAARGWTVRMAGGVPEWLPPPWLDRHRSPRRNTAHHPPDLEFAALDLPPPGRRAA